MVSSFIFLYIHVKLIVKNNTSTNVSVPYLLGVKVNGNVDQMYKNKSVNLKNCVNIDSHFECGTQICHFQILIL